MLQRHIEILHRLWLFGEHVEKSIADVGWISVHYTHPFDSIGVRKLAQQVRQRIRLAEVFAVTRRVLRYQDQFLHAFFGQLVRLSDDRAKATAAKVAAHLGNETESTGAIAAFGDLDEGVVTGRRKHARRRFVV